jgi:glycosyltransferase involved in cell wall biosynthesis
MTLDHHKHRLGLGATALAHSQLSGHADGIGTYSSELLSHFQHAATDFSTTPLVFGRRYAGVLPASQAFPWVYSASTALAAVSKLPFRGAAKIEAGIDLFHSTDHYIPRLKKTPVVATIMDVIGIRHPEWVNPQLRQLKNALFKKAAGWADHIITISQFSANDLADALGIATERITSIGLGVNPAFFDQLAADVKAEVLQRYALKPGFFLVVGTLQPRKNVERIVQAHAMLPMALRKAHPLVVVGQEGWRSEQLRGQLAALQAQGCGQWLKYVPRSDLYAFLQSAQALLFPSLYEGFGLPLLEGFAAQVPVIASNTTSLPEVAGDAALLIDPLRADALADAMQSTIDRVGERANWIAKGLVQAQRFSWQETARQTMAVYERFW